ncbi:hypothetical protein C0991_000945 [Blastosporella zonata]|nr:hypothetical protein C0991_000945 [Blastosporella zonata]
MQLVNDRGSCDSRPVYTNSFLATLNARKTLTGKVDDVSHMLVSLPPTLLNSQTGANKIGGQQTISIRIDQEHTFDHNREFRSRSRLDDKTIYSDREDDVPQVAIPVATKTRRTSLESDQYPV